MFKIYLQLIYKLTINQKFELYDKILVLRVNNMNLLSINHMPVSVGTLGKRN